MNSIKQIAAMLAAFACFASFAPAAFSQELPEWLRTMKISGDIGGRAEYINDKKRIDHYDRVRTRARFRLWVNTTFRDRMQGHFGLETSGTNPTSAWTDFTNFRNAPVYLAHLYMSYEFSDSLTVSGGKLKSDMPFWTPTQLVWKSDVNPFGVAANAGLRIGSDFKVFVNGGAFALTEYRDNMMSIDLPMNAIAVVQPGIEYKRGNFSAKGAFTVQQFSLVNHNRHSTTDWLREYRSFTLVNPAWEASWNNLAGSYGATFTGEYSKNLNESAEGRATQAYMLQAGFGNERIDRFKAWQVKVAYRRLEQNAIPYGFGNTSAYDADAGKGWEYSAALGLLKNLSFNATIYNLTDLEGNMPQTVSQFDVIYRF